MRALQHAGGALQGAAQLAQVGRRDPDHLAVAGDDERPSRAERAHHHALARLADDHRAGPQAQRLRSALLLGAGRAAGEQPVEQVAAAALGLRRQRVTLAQVRLRDRVVDRVRVREREPGQLLRDAQALRAVAGRAHDRLPERPLADQVGLQQRIQRAQIAGALGAARAHEVELLPRRRAPPPSGAHERPDVLAPVLEHLREQRRVRQARVLVDLLADGPHQAQRKTVGVLLDLVEDVLVEVRQIRGHICGGMSVEQ